MRLINEQNYEYLEVDAMAPPAPPCSAAAQPKYSLAFDAFNSSSTGHQRAENRLGGSTGWRNSRNMKLSSQFKSAGTGGKRISDQVGAGSEDWDEKVKALIPREVRMGAKRNIRDMLVIGRSGSKCLFSLSSSFDSG